MSDTRALIVEALGKVDPPLSVTTAVPPNIVTGSAWPAWGSTSWRNACLTEDEWFVFVALPNAEQGVTVGAGDVSLDDVAAALWLVGKVTRAEPWAWPVESGQAAVPVLRFTLATSGKV